MYKTLIRFCLLSTCSFFVGAVFVLLFNLNYIGLNIEAFPAIDLIIIYYITTYRDIEDWHLFILGLIIDQIYQIPIGVTSISLIVAGILLNKNKRLKVTQSHCINTGIFCIYNMFITVFRFLIVWMYNDNYIQEENVCVHYFLTISLYPIMKIILNKYTYRVTNYAGH